jgi:hypothetical protein
MTEKRVALFAGSDFRLCRAICFFIHCLERMNRVTKAISRLVVLEYPQIVRRAEHDMKTLGLTPLAIFQASPLFVFGVRITTCRN